MRAGDQRTDRERVEEILREPCERLESLLRSPASNLKVLQRKALITCYNVLNKREEVYVSFSVVSKQN